MPVALVTGETTETGVVSAGFERQGFDVHSAAPWGMGELPPGGIDCYVQLPSGQAPTAPVVGRGGLVGRLDLLALIARRLSPEATVLLAVDGGGTPGPRSSDDLLSTLAGVVLEQAGRPHVRVEIVPAGELTAGVTTAPSGAPLAVLSA